MMFPHIAALMAGYEIPLRQTAALVRGFITKN
jgi:hypothetical protein